MMRSGYNNGGLLRVSRCSVFVMNSLILLEYTDCFCGISCSFLTLACVTSVPYRIVSSSERIAIRTVAFVSAIYRCIVSALLRVNMNNYVKTLALLGFWLHYSPELESASQKCPPSPGHYPLINELTFSPELYPNTDMLNKRKQNYRQLMSILPHSICNKW